MQYATTRDGVRIAFGTAGKGSWLVRAPGLPFTHCQLEWSQGSEFFDHLADNWSVVQFDPRGTGLSDRDVTDFSLEARLLDLEAVVAKLGLETFALHGIGWSGPLVITYAVRHPERVSQLILDDSQARTADFMNVPQVRALDQLIEEWDSFLEHMVFTFFGLGREQARPHIEFFRACITQDVARRIFAAVRQDDATALLSQVTMPALIVQHGSASKQNVEAARVMAASIPNARLVMLDGLAQDDLARMVRAIGDLLGTEPAIRAQRPAAPATTAAAGVRTILFTDMVEHTEMMRRLGDSAGREVLREHEEITRDVLRRHGGDEVKTLGDGFMASFPSVTGAVECAIDLQRAFDVRNTGVGAHHDAPLHVRIGLNAGEPIAEAGDLFGATVIMAARIAAQAGGGEILVADTVRGLCSGKGFLFADRGENVLRGFEDPVRLYEVRWRE